MYAIVEFIGADGEETSNEVAIVPLIWVHTNDKRCYWPNRTKNINFKTFVKNLTPYKKSWPSYKVFKIHLKTDSYNAAEQFLTDMLKDLASEADRTDGSTRSLRRKDTADESSDESSDNNVAVANLQLVQTRKPIRNEQMLQTREPIRNDEEVVQTRETIRNADFEKYMMESIEKIMCHINQHSIILNELVRNARKTNEMTTGAPPESTPTFPIQSTADFVEFDNSLGTDECLAQYMRTRLAAVGGSGLESLTRRMLRYLMSDSVALAYNWSGRDKLPFKETKICPILKDAAKKNFPTSEQNDHVVENTIKEWLKHAKTRLKSRKQTDVISASQLA